MPIRDRSFPLPDLQAWTDCFARAELPVMAQTAEALEALRANEDDVDANLLGEMISDDPLMTLKVQAYAASHRRGDDGHQPVLSRLRTPAYAGR